MDKIRLKYIGGKSVAKLYFNRVRYIFNKGNNFIADVPLGMWNLAKKSNVFTPAPIEKETETPKGEIAPDKPVDGKVCEICGFKAKTVNGKNTHKRIKHKEGK